MSELLPDEWPCIAHDISPPTQIYPDHAANWQAITSRPIIDETAWVAQGATVVGRVRLQPRSSIWFGCVLRGDEEFIDVGSETNVQDGSVLHVDAGFPCVLGSRVTIGHRATVHASVVGDGAMIAMGATVLSRCTIGEGALIAAGAVLREGTNVDPHTLWVGCPAHQVGELNPDQRERLAHAWQHYVNAGGAYLKRFGRDHIRALDRGVIAEHGSAHASGKPTVGPQPVSPDTGS
jgi:carbonic anhydrase/acetyltransferase-like protein (isoleucine patch superfamily)